MTRAVDNVDLPSASHYSQAVRSGPLVFTAGHIAIDTSRPGMPLVNTFDDLPEEGRFLATGRSHPDSRDGPIAVQSWYVYAKLRNTLAEQGLVMKDVVNANVYLSDLRDLAVFHRVHRHFFPEDPPALCVTGFDEVGHRNCRVEIELTAADPADGLARVDVGWQGALPLACPAARRIGPLAFFSGMCGIDLDGMLVRDPCGIETGARQLVASVARTERLPGIAAECWQAMENLRLAAQQLDCTLDDLVKLTVYVGNGADIAVFDAIRSAFIADASLPALEVVTVHGPAPIRDLHVQVEAIAMIGR